MANLGTASIPIIPSTTINIPKPGLLYTGASTNAGGANTTLTPEAVSPATTFNMVSVGDIVYNTTVSPNTIGVITGLNYTGSNITSVDTNITWNDGDDYNIYHAYKVSNIPQAVDISSLLVGDGTLTSSITTNTTDGSNGSYTGATFSTSGSGTGAVIDVTVSGNAVTAVDVTTAGSGYEVGDTLTVATSVIGGSAALVITLVDEDITGDAANVTDILKNQGMGEIGIYTKDAGDITGVDSMGNTFSISALAGDTLPFFVSRINTSSASAALVGFINPS